MSKTATAAKKKAAPKTEKTERVRIVTEKPESEEERVLVRILVSREYATGTTSFHLGKGKKVSLPLAVAERHAERKNLVIL